MAARCRRARPWSRSTAPRRRRPRRRCIRRARCAAPPHADSGSGFRRRPGRNRRCAGLMPRRSDKLLLRIAVAPAQEIDDVERVDLAEQFAAAVRFGALQRLFQQSERLEACRDFLRAIDDFADADDDGDAVFGDGGGCIRHFSCFAFLDISTSLQHACSSVDCDAQAKQSIELQSKSGLLRRYAPRNDGDGCSYSATSAFMCSTASTKSSLNSCTTAPADFTLSIRPTPWPTK